jgi:F5/8 type C domain
MNDPQFRIAALMFMGTFGMVACTSNQATNVTTSEALEINASPGKPSAPAGAFDRSTWKIIGAPAGSSNLKAMIDGNGGTFWTSSSNQTNSMAVQIDLGQNRIFNRLVIDAGVTKNTLRSYNIYLSQDPNSWGEYWVGGSGNSQARLEIELAARNGRYLTIQAGYDNPSQPWSIAEVYVATTGASPVPVPSPNPSPTPAPTPSGKVWKFLPLGDSNTAGGGYDNEAEKQSTHYSYRGNLYNRLSTAGFNIDYLGTRQAGIYPGTASQPETIYHGNMTEEIPDKDHGGYGSFSMYSNPCNFSEFPSGNCNLDDNLAQMLAGNPDIILLMIGHNGGGDSTKLIADIRAIKPNARIFFGGYPNLKDNLGIWQDQRDRAKALAANPANNISYVDLNNALPNSSDFISSDNVHHSKAGAEKIAARFYAALEPYLRSR